MSKVPESVDRRAFLIREMAKQSERSHSRGSGSLASSAGSVVAEARFENDTQTRELPALRPEPEFQINTSALRRAFPDFSQYGSSDEDSIEVGRGLKGNTRDTPNKNLESADVTENMSFTIGDGARYHITATPPIKTRNTNVAKMSTIGNSGMKSNDSARRGVSAKENIAPLARGTEYVSGTTNSRINEAARKGLAELHATVESDDSVSLNGSRPAAVALNTKNTRFRQSLEQPNTTVDGTYQSFMLPDIANITEIVSGLRSAKRSRFATPLQSQRTTGTPHGHRAHFPIDKVPVPIEEQALYISLQLLQDKVCDLESENAKMEKQLEESELEVLQLRSALEEQDGKMSRREKAVHMLGSLAKELWIVRKELAKAGTSAQSVHSKNDDALSSNQGMAEKSGEIQPDSQLGLKSSAQTRMALVLSRDNDMLSSNHQATGRLAELRQPRPESRVLSSNVGASRVSLQPIMERTATRHARERNTYGGDTTTDIQFVNCTNDEELRSEPAEFMSFMEGDEIEKLRQVVDEDKQLLAKATGNKPQEVNDQAADTTRKSAFRPVPRKSSLKRTQQKQKDLTIQAENDLEAANEPTKTCDRFVNTDGAADEDVRPGVSFDYEKQDTQHSIVSQRSERPRRNDAREMTSAFILPDITLAATGLTGRQSIVVSRPIPVSDRVPLPAPGEEDPTIRPAQAPGLALAAVLRGLNDELKQLQEQLSQQESLYKKHDPSLSKRKRKIVYTRMQKLMAAIDRRADQIYALYDVVEGQKEKGQLMTEEEVEVTLQNIGIDESAARNLAGEMEADSEVEGEGSEDGLDIEDSELPWEGIEPTQTQTLGSLRSLRIR